MSRATLYGFNCGVAGMCVGFAFHAAIRGEAWAVLYQAVAVAVNLWAASCNRRLMERST